MITCLFVAFVVLMLLGIPISVALVLAAALSIVGLSDYSLSVIPQKLFHAGNSFPLLAVPFFVLAGGIMGSGGMSDRLIALARALVGQVRGGLGMVSVLACMFFAAISGSTAATTASIGMIMIPALIHSGYSPGSATSLQATAGSIGIIIPPSIPLVLMGVIGGMSIGDLFLGGVGPGVLIGLSLMAAAHLVARFGGHKQSGDRLKLSRLARTFLAAIPSLLTIVIVIGGIIGGLVTPTEAAILAVLWSLLVSGVFYRSLSGKALYGVCVDTVKITGIVILCIGATAPFAWLLTVERVPEMLGQSILSLSSNAVILKLLVLLILLAIGMFMDLTPAMILLVPILKPIAMTLGMDLVHFGVITVMALGIGQCTPPVGIALFVACGISKVRLEKLIWPLMPYLLAMFAALLVCTYCPKVVTWLPQWLSSEHA
jgi:C4-dicarboxylate transporter DctM subunit